MDERLVYTNYMSLYDMPGAGVIDNNYLYYICLNNNKLIKYNLLLGEIEKVYYIPIKNCKKDFFDTAYGKSNKCFRFRYR